MSESNAAVMEKNEKTKPGHKAPPPVQKPGQQQGGALSGVAALEKMADDTAAGYGDRQPRLGEDVIYSLGSGSERAGEFRAAKISYVWGEDSEYAGTVNLVWLVGRRDDAPANKARYAHYSFPANGVDYDPTGKPGTWHFLDDGPTENPTGKKSREERAGK
jgi:hypothetical protein